MPSQPGWFGCVQIRFALRNRTVSDGLNSAQRQAVLHIDTPLLVLAGAGSGKTRVIVEKIAHLVASDRYPAQRIAAITFTNKAAREMKQRLGQRMKVDASEGPTVCTFHALGLKVLQIEHQKAGLKRGFSIFDSDDQLGQIKDLLPSGTRPDVAEALRQAISRVKNAGLDPAQAQAQAASAVEHEAAALYARYQQRLANFNAVDFDDLIRLPLALLEADAELAAGWRERLRYILVDECQDTNGAQYRMLRQLAGPRGAFTCVGDDDQSIYAWRGAEPENLNRLAEDYPRLTVIKLEQNYRCSARILRAANALIERNPHAYPKRLWSERDDGPPIRVRECENATQEAERVAAEIDFLHRQWELPWSEFAVLFRGNHQSRPLEKALQQLRVPYHLTGGTAFLDRGEVKDALSWLRVLANPDDDAAFLRAIAAPKRAVGGTSLARLAELAGHAGMSLSRASDSIALLKQLPPRAAAGLNEFNGILSRLRGQARQVPPAALVRLLVEQSGLLADLRSQCKDEAGFQRRRANLEELADWFDDDDRSGPGELAAQLALLAHADCGEPGNQVRLMSLHAAKGLEFECVFIVGCEDGVLPHEASIDEGRLEEERRLLYVGITRAKRYLQLSHSQTSQRWGQNQKLAPSRFIEELPVAELHRDGEDPARDATLRQERAQARFKAIAELLGD
ncbi:MAG: UvrD-helicase domain-containing protein [Xanthomonadaceae bacterium]|nr:UvrD-helicase domain-containing protein [Xanthomonadaceae bacterium]